MLGVQGGGGDPTPPGPGDHNISPLFIPRSQESQTSGAGTARALSHKTINTESHTNHLLLGAGDADSGRLAPGPGLTLDTDNDPDHSDHTTYFSLAWPSEGAPPDLLLYIVAGCSGFVSAVIRAVCVVTRVSPTSASDGDGPAWVTGNIVTLSPLPPAPASLPASLCSQPRRPLTARLPHTQLTCQANLTPLSCYSNDQLLSLISLACFHHPCLQ